MPLKRYVDNNLREILSEQSTTTMTTNFTRNFSCGEMTDIEEIKVKMYSDKISNKLMLFQRWKFWVSGVSTCVIGSLGFVGNILSLLILSRRWKVLIIISQQLYDLLFQVHAQYL